MTFEEIFGSAGTTEMEGKWMDAVEAADADNPLWKLLGPRTDGDALALRTSMTERGLILTTDHAASSYGIPVAVDAQGKAYGPGDQLPHRNHGCS